MTDKDIVKKVEREMRDENRKAACVVCGFFMATLVMLGLGGFFNPFCWEVCIVLLCFFATFLLTVLFSMALFKATAAKEEGNDID